MKTTKRAKSKLTIGLDLGDRKHAYCVLDERGMVGKEGSMVGEWARKEVVRNLGD